MIGIGRLGTLALRPGYYVYAGSAFGRDGRDPRPLGMREMPIWAPDFEGDLRCGSLDVRHFDAPKRRLLRQMHAAPTRASPTNSRVPGSGTELDLVRTRNSCTWP